MPKRSSLAGKIRTNIVGPDIRYPDRLIIGHKKCPKNDHSNIGRFGGLLYSQILITGLRYPDLLDIRTEIRPIIELKVA